MVRLETVLNSWKSERENTVSAVEDFAADQLDFKPVPEVFSFRETARHILEAGDAIVGLLLEGVDRLITPDVWDKAQKHVRPVPENADAATLAAALRASIAERCAELARQPAEFFQRPVAWCDGTTPTVLEVIQFVKEHEIAHRAQMFLYLRMKGIVPATTRRYAASRSRPGQPKPPRRLPARKNSHRGGWQPLPKRSRLYKGNGFTSPLSGGRAMITCPICDAELDAEEDELDEGDTLTCDECGAELRVAGVDPLELEPLEEEEEDEEAVDYEEEEDEEDENWK